MYLVKDININSPILKESLSAIKKLPDYPKIINLKLWFLDGKKEVLDF